MIWNVIVSMSNFFNFSLFLFYVIGIIKVLVYWIIIEMATEQ